MAEEIDLKLQEIKNAIYFLAETLEKHYVEQTQKIDVLAESVDKLAAGAPLAPQPGAAPQSSDLQEIKSKLSEVAEKISACQLPAQAREGDATVIKSLDLIAKHLLELKKSVEPLEAINFRKLVLTIEKLASSAPSAAALAAPVSAAASPETEKEVAEVLAQVRELKKQNASIAEACALIMEELEKIEAGLGAR
ncbi:MAG: hypothetical protein ACP5IG_00025 [Candidatus Micrarchaeia archaeon]